ncbi:hypothetical protein KDW74_gp57 [Mycobacterium phage Antsirabe]|uniref:Uncharacterized protein n=1 Tax=Mycobacterium phage Antsirabe TaxID=2575610 RepID=A0A5J6TGJ9_9CAUD|nr:hypothetical protein KDW74_gp57 [Mycobacterium phage Antsirabe]QFG10011.1 hypothetical protein PBI_ANTSIRABE_57 [Mycobacterium phage Antsirabe]
MAKGKRGGTRKSLKCPDVYDALRRKGYSKTKSAKISNAQCRKNKARKVIGRRRNRR